MRLLDDDSVPYPDRLRLIILYLIYRNGLLAGDIRKLLAHAKLPPQDGTVIANLDLLGVRVEKPLGDNQPAPQSLFPRKPPPPSQQEEEVSLSRFEPALKLVLEEQVKGTLDPTVFPYTRPQTESDAMLEQINQASLRSVKPTWARSQGASKQPRQRILVFMAGGATYAESRACYEVSNTSSRDIFLATSHMLTPGLFLRQVGDLSADRRRLDIPAERPRPTAPAHLFEQDPPPQPKPGSQAPSRSATATPPTKAMQNLSLNGRSSTPPSASTTSSAKPDKKDKKKRFPF